MIFVGSGLHWDEDHCCASPRSQRGCSEGLRGDGDSGTGSQELTGEASGEAWEASGTASSHRGSQTSKLPNREFV